MMTVQEYRAWADALEASADVGANAPLMRHLDASAREWRKLGDIADGQDSMLAALATMASGRTA
jgi:DNA-binding FadR family transcriptional regulator